MKVKIKKINEAAKVLRDGKGRYSTSEEFPWRRENTPYRIFLAEFLLVRTRADVVTHHYKHIFSQFPNLEALAESKERELSEAIRPLGLRKRVPYLIQAAKYILENHRGEIPNNIDELNKVPGIGLYTSVAIAAFAFGSDVVPADVNILRLLSRLTGLPMDHPTKGSNDLRKLLPLLSKNKGGPEPENLLDFSRLVCVPRNPKCEECPLTNYCHYYETVYCA